MHAVTGSLAFVAAARIVLIAINENESGERMLLLPVKNNLGKRPDGPAYRLVQRIITNDIVASYVAWDTTAPVNTTANEALADAAESAKETQRDS